MGNKIKGKSYDELGYKEARADAEIVPGMGIEYAGVDERGNLLVQPVSTAGAGAPRFAREQRHPPRSVGGENPIDTPYTPPNNVEYLVFRPGDEVENALLASGSDLETAGDATIGVGDLVSFTDNGTLSAETDRTSAVAVALEEVDNSGSDAGDFARICVEVI